LLLGYTRVELHSTLSPAQALQTLSQLLQSPQRHFLESLALADRSVFDYRGPDYRGTVTGNCFVVQNYYRQRQGSCYVTAIKGSVEARQDGCLVRALFLPTPFMKGFEVLVPLSLVGYWVGRIDQGTLFLLVPILLILNTVSAYMNYIKCNRFLDTVFVKQLFSRHSSLSPSQSRQAEECNTL